MKTRVKNNLKHVLYIALIFILSACSKEDMHSGAYATRYKVKVTMTGDLHAFHQTLEVRGTDFQGNYGAGLNSSPGAISEAQDPESEFGFSNTHLEGYYNEELGSQDKFLLFGDHKHTFYVSYSNIPKKDIGSYSMTINIVVYKSDENIVADSTYPEIENVTETFTTQSENTKLEWFYSYEDE